MRTHAMMYHDVVASDPDASGFRGAGPARYKLTTTQFLDHVAALEGAVHEPPIAVDDLLAGPTRRSPWLLTFDDGGVSALDTARELSQRGWRGHFLVTTAYIGESGFLDESGIRELRRMGHVIGTHSVSHPRMSALPEAELLEEWRTSAEILSALVGEKIRSASVPGGYLSKRVVRAAARAGIEALFTSEPVRKTRHSAGCLVIGRLAIRTTTSPRDAARIALGDSRIWFRANAGWKVRKAAKVVPGMHYQRLRHSLLSRSGARERT